MPYNNLGDLDNSNMNQWAESPETAVFVAEIRALQGLAFKALIKGGEKKHTENAERYNAFDKILSLIEEARKLR